MRGISHLFPANAGNKCRGILEIIFSSLIPREVYNRAQLAIKGAYCWNVTYPHDYLATLGTLVTMLSKVTSTTVQHVIDLFKTLREVSFSCSEVSVAGVRLVLAAGRLVLAARRLVLAAVRLVLTAGRLVLAAGRLVLAAGRLVLAARRLV